MALTELLVPAVIILVVLAVLNVPLYLAILLAAMYITFSLNLSLENMFSGFFNNIAKTSFLCIPFFLLTGTLIQASSLGMRLINLFMVLLQHTASGLAIACLFANAVFGAISGSSPAAVATFGRVIFPPLSKVQGEKLALGIITSSGALSTIIPPSIMLIVFGIATDTSITRLFMGGILPGVVLVVIVAFYLMWRCTKNNKLGLFESEIKPKATMPELKEAGKKAIPVIFLPIIILGGIYCGLFTPTEAAAVSSIYSLVIAVFVLKDIKLKDLPKVLIDTCRVTGQTFALVAASTLFAQALTIAQIPGLLTEGFASFDKITFLIMLNVLLLVIGCFFDTAAAILILAPLLMPAAMAIGIDPVHLGIVFTVNLSIGMFTPPFGMNIFVAQSILDKSMGLIARSVVPYICLYIGGLLIITYVPQIALFLPKLLF